MRNYESPAVGQLDEDLDEGGDEWLSESAGDFSSRAARSTPAGPLVSAAACIVQGLHPACCKLLQRAGIFSLLLKLLGVCAWLALPVYHLQPTHLL